MLTPSPDTVAWVASPSLVPDDTWAIETDIPPLTSAARADDREALAQFVAVALAASRQLSAQPANARSVARQLRQMASTVGATSVAAAAADAEQAALMGNDLRPALLRLDRSIAEARAVIDLILGRS